MTKYNKEALEIAVKQSKSFADVCRIFGVKDSTGSQSHIATRIKAFNISTSHFTGKGWRVGQTFKKEWSDVTKYLFKGSRVSSHTLKLKLFKAGLKKQECESCYVAKWLGEDVVLELDHIDSDHFNNELSNLQILCSNCHATFTRQRIKQRRSGEMARHASLRS